MAGANDFPSLEFFLSFFHRSVRGGLALILLAALVVLFAFVSSNSSLAGVGGSISGTATDPSGAVVPGAVVMVRNVDTGVLQNTTTDPKGFYAFAALPIGRYEINIKHSGFETYNRTGLVIGVNTSLRVDVNLKLGPQQKAITVSDTAVHAETSNTQMGDLITGTTMTAVPLNGRSYTDLLSLQPGVAPITSLTSESIQDVGAAALPPSGDLDPGNLSISGQREYANGFMVNGSDVEEDVNMGAAVVPNLDSIAEFRILTSDFDAEYGNYSGGQINVVTKSGTNQFHGDAFEFLRNTDFDARNFYSPDRGSFQQNQFGGTFGGPIRRDKVFFFADYQGTRLIQGVDTGLIPVPSVRDRDGNLSDEAGSLTGTVNGPYWAGLLSQKLGYTVSPGEPYYTPGCASPAQCVLPNAMIPMSAWSAPAQHLLQYIPKPNSPGNNFSTSAYNQDLRDDKGALRLDASTRWGLLSGYYFMDDYSQNNPYPVAQGGASVPGFNALNLGRAQLLDLGDTKTLGPSAVNEFHFSFLRNTNILGQPLGGVGVSLASQGFTVGPNTPGIVPLSPQTEGVENIVFNSYSIGTNTNRLADFENTFQWLDNFSKVVGNHTIKAGAEFHYDQVNTLPNAQFNGSFSFFGSETGLDFADFLLGTPSQYNQSYLQSFYGRNKYAGLYGQDSWRVTHNLTLNYGLRWDRIEPWYEKYNQISAMVPGEQSVVFPGAPAGIVYPTDPGIPRTLAPAGNLDFSPRLGLAYSPDVQGTGLLSKLLGGPGKTSLRAGFGTFYTDIEAATIGVLAANAPYGTTYTSPAPPLFATPFVTASTGQNLGQYFPVQLAPLDSSASHPDSNINWSQYEPISGIPTYAPSNKIPSADEYTFSLERQIGSNTLVSASYVGTQAHHLLVLVENNPGNPALCLSLSQPSEVMPGTATCGPFGESNVYTAASGRVIDGTRGPFGADFGSNTNQAAMGNSNYNALEISVHHTSGPLELFAGYTYSKSLDQSSNFGEEVNPLNYQLSKALSAFDMTHNFVASYDLQLPMARLFRIRNRWTQGWSLSGITHFATGFPVTLYNYGDNSLLGAEPNGVNNYGVDEPDYTPGPLEINSNPRNGKPYFNTTLFSENALGTPGTAARRFFYGPGINNFDLALLKNVRLTESKSLQFRLEAFNAFNHAQFYGPSAVDGNISSSTFGQVVSAAAPRILQIAAKLNF
jgi:Carboxypeptidase regulatory-like domain